VSEGDPRPDALRGLIDSVGREHASEVVARAQAEAISRATAVLAEEMAKSILDHARAGATRPAKPTAPRPDRDTARATPSRIPDSSPPAAGSGVWVYGVVAGVSSELLDAVEGLAGVAPSAPPELLDHGGLAAIVSSVPLAEFGEEPLRENLNDVEWLERIARAHDAVLEAAVQVETVVPLRICTIYASVEHVQAMLSERGPMFADALGHLEGKTELGVKLIAEPGALERALSSDVGDAAHAAGSPGLAYLRGKEREARARDDAEQLAAEWIEEAHTPLAAIAAEALLNPLQNPELSGYAGEMLLNGVYLVADDRRAEFMAEAERLAADFDEREVTIELTGPWPPYNFVNGSIEAAR
jgi:hypothetical protein